VPEAPRKTATLVAVSAGLFMLLLDLSIVYVALPSLKTSLDASLMELQWIVDSYAIALAATLLAAGALADIVGRRRVFCAGLALFAVASLGCGLVRTAPELIAGRTVQGLGAALMFSTSFAIVGVTFEGRARTQAFGVLGVVSAVAGALGPLVGGALVESVGWPTIFFVNVPVGVGALLLASRVVEESRRPDPPPVDWAGALLLCALLGLLTLALLRGNDEGWSSSTIVGLLGGAATCLVAFVVVEQRRRYPLLDLGLLRRRTFLGVSLVAFAQAASLFALLLYVVIYLQGLLGYSPFASGLALLPLSLAALPPGLGAAWLAARLPTPALLASGLAAIAAGLALLTRLQVGDTWVALLPTCLLVGTGLGLVGPPLAAAAVDVAPAGRAGLGSGINATFRQIGIAIGVAAYGALFEHRVAAEVMRGLEAREIESYAGRVTDAVVAGGLGETVAAAPQAWRPFVGEVAAHSFLAGLHLIALVAAGVAMVVAVLVGVLVRTRDLGGAVEDASLRSVERAGSQAGVGARPARAAGTTR